jgi:hypothetical protein
MELLAVIDRGRCTPDVLPLTIVRIQGGQSLALQERAVIAQERLARLPPKAVAMARGLRDRE